MPELPDDIVSFLNQPNQLAMLATTGEDGFPHVTPMWYAYEYAYDEPALWMWTWKERVKYRNTQVSRRVGVYVQAVEDVHKGLAIKGMVQHHDTDVADRARQIARRYVGDGELPLWIEHILYGDTVLLEVTLFWYARNGSSWNL